jgi:hypothetical protein
MTMITAQDRKAFAALLDRSHIDRVGDTVGMLEDTNWKYGEFVMGDLPTTLPTPVRRQISALLKMQREVGKALSGLQTELLTVAAPILARKEDAQEAAKPRCTRCGQVVRKQAKRRR